MLLKFRVEIMKYYFAYGSNLCKNQMLDRCPESEYVFSGRLDGYKWFIYSRGYANIMPSKQDYVLGEIFSLSDADEERLDGYENVFDCAYSKENIQINTPSGFIECLVYVDHVREYGEAKDEYVHRINRGLVSANLSKTYIDMYIRPFVKG